MPLLAPGDVPEGHVERLHGVAVIVGVGVGVEFADGDRAVGGGVEVGRFVGRGRGVVCWVGQGHGTRMQERMKPRGDSPFDGRPVLEVVTEKSRSPGHRLDIAGRPADRDTLSIVKLELVVVGVVSALDIHVGVKISPRAGRRIDQSRTKRARVLPISRQAALGCGACPETHGER